jgi:hypothetical protein
MVWQPIETAPKDGSLFLAWCASDDHFFIGRWNKKFQCWSADMRLSEVDDVTHWQPLPSPPAQE